MKTLKGLSMLFIGVAATASAGVSAFFVFKGLQNNQVSFENLKNYGELKEYFFDYNGKKVAKFVPGETIKVNMYEAKNNLAIKAGKPEEESYEYYLDDKGVEDLIAKFFQNAVIGPELSDLKSINIDANNKVPDGSNGVFFPGSGEIGLDGDTYLKDLYTLKDRSKYTASQERSYKVEIMAETLVHEYGHFVAYHYPSSPHPDEIIQKTAGAISEEYQDDETGIEYKGTNYWNGNFVNKFKEIFTYDKPKEPNYQQTSPIKDDKGKTYDSLGKIYNAYDLFNTANKTHTWKDNDETLYARSASVSNKFAWWKANNELLKYYYSMEELFTRRLLSSTYVSGWNGNGIVDDEFIWKYTDGATSITEDWMSYETPRGNHWVEYPFAEQYLSDGAFMNRPSGATAPKGVPQPAQALTELLAEATGATDGDNLSIIIPKNDAEVTNRGGSLVYETGKVSGDDYNKIKFGGYFNNSDNYKYIIYEDKGEWKKIPIASGQYTGGYKDSLFAKNRNSLANGHKWYSIKNWINANDIVGKILYFSTDGLPNTKVALTSIRDNQYGKVASYLEEIIDEIKENSNIYEAVKNTNGVSIGKWGKWNQL